MGSRPNKWRWENNSSNVCKDGWEKEINHSTMSKVFVVVKVQKLVILESDVNADDQCQSNFCDNAGNSNGGTCGKGYPGTSCVAADQCVHGICESGTCRYINNKHWNDDPNAWRWKDKSGNLCKNGYEAKWVVHNGTRFCGRAGSKAGRFGERCGADDQCNSNVCDNVGNSKGGTCGKGYPGTLCAAGNQCVHNICQGGTCRYPGNAHWNDDPNAWRWQDKPGNLCANGYEAKWVVHNGTRFCGRPGSLAGHQNERCGADDQCRSFKCHNLGHSKRWILFWCTSMVGWSLF